MSESGDSPTHCELSWILGGSVGFLIDLFRIFELTIVVVRGRGSSSWLPHIGQSVTLCARATRAILNHAPIREYKQHFFPVECTQCPCGHCQVETRRHIFAGKKRCLYSPIGAWLRMALVALAHNVTDWPM